MPAQETGKQRAARIPLDYYKQSDVLERWKVRLGGLALVIPLAWIGAHFVFSEQRDFLASRGSVAAMHQMWNAECSACHVDFTPISNHSWLPPFLHDAKESAARCQVCHTGTAHHPTHDAELSCGSCHREHRGPQASLVRLPDSDCTQCHHDLASHEPVKPVSARVRNPEYDHVSVFGEKTHPPFRSSAKDPGKLKFNHRRHLAEGIPNMDGNTTGGKIKRLGDIPNPYRQRYQDQQERKGDSDWVQLQCASCHQLDAGDFGASERSAGAYMQPIAYEKHCVACHPLTVARNVFDDEKGGHLTVPHGWRPQEIHELLQNFTTAQVARGQAGFLEKKVSRPLPGKLAGFLPPTAKRLIDQKVQMVEKRLYVGAQACALCHEFKTPYASLDSVADLHMEPTKVPRVWFKHAKFDHSAHRAVRCAECHAGAESSSLATDVLIPKIDNCVLCHAPTTSAGTPGARFDCTECHRYHDGEQRTKGVKAAQREPVRGRAIESFLLGE